MRYFQPIVSCRCESAYNGAFIRRLNNEQKRVGQPVASGAFYTRKEVPSVTNSKYVSVGKVEDVEKE